MSLQRRIVQFRQSRKPHRHTSPPFLIKIPLKLTFFCVGRTLSLRGKVRKTNTKQDSWLLCAATLSNKVIGGTRLQFWLPTVDNFSS